MVLDVSQCSCNGQQITLRADYGFPPPPSVLNTTMDETSHTFNTTLLPSFISPPATPLPASPHQRILLHTQSQEPQTLDHSAKKRLYNNRGSICQPACGKLVYASFFFLRHCYFANRLQYIESCHNTRKKCDVERPCTRCINYAIPCVERPPRVKRRRIQQRPSVNLYHKQPFVNTVPGGLPSPVSELPSDTRSDTPMELDHAPGLVVRSVGHIFNPSSYNTPITPTGSSGTRIMGGPSGPSDSNLDISIDGPLHPEPPNFLDIPPPIGNYLEGVSLISSEAPIFGLEGSDLLTMRNFQRVLDSDLSIGDEKVCRNERQSHLIVDNFEFIAPMLSAQELDPMFGEKDLRTGFGQLGDLCSPSMIPDSNVSYSAGNSEWSCDWRIS